MQRMGRKRKHNRGLPARVYMRGKSYYYVRPTDGKWIRLADTLPEMHRRLAEVIEDKPNTRTMAGLFARYRDEILPEKAPKTQREYSSALDKLEAYCGKMRPHGVQPKHVAAYLDKRTAKSAANREIAVLSAVYTKAIRWGITDTNPCTGVERNKERPSTQYVTDEQFMAVYRIAPPMIRHAMAIAYLTGQRQADVIKLRRRHITDAGIYVKQRKTGREIIIEWTPALRKAIRRALTTNNALAFDYVIRSSNGSPYTSSGFQTAWQRIMRKLPPDVTRFQFRDIRAKARSDGDDKQLLGHANPDAMARIYQRKPTQVHPVR